MCVWAGPQGELSLWRRPSGGGPLALAHSYPRCLVPIRRPLRTAVRAHPCAGPLEILLAHGANIVAVDLNRAGIWRTLIAKAKASCGTLTFPLDEVPLTFPADDAWLAAHAGADLFQDTPKVIDWLLNRDALADVPRDSQLTVGNYTYLNGGLHVQLSLACDSIIAALCRARSNTAVAFLCTPTDCHVIEPAAFAAAEANHAAAPLWQRAFEALGMLRKNSARAMVVEARGTKAGTLQLVDGLVVAQGPNYALAKRLQHWRAVLAHGAGHTVATNVAPSTATLSVVQNAMFAAAYGGFHKFAPMEVMYQHTSNAVMGALLIHDIRNPKAAANGRNAAQLDNPMQLFTHGAFHGGVWRCAYTIGTIGTPAFLANYVIKFPLAVLAALGLLPLAAAWVFSPALAAVGVVLPF